MEEEKIFVGKRHIGSIKVIGIKIYECWRDFYKHQYHVTQSYYWEEELIDKLKNEGVKFIRLKEKHINKISSIDESKTFLFPITLFNNSPSPELHHKNKDFGEQIGIKREIIEKYEIEEGIKFLEQTLKYFKEENNEI